MYEKEYNLLPFKFDLKFIYQKFSYITTTKNSKRRVFFVFKFILLNLKW